jgi:hypothetical protein
VALIQLFPSNEIAVDTSLLTIRTGYGILPIRILLGGPVLSTKDDVPRQTKKAIFLTKTKICSWAPEELNAKMDGLTDPSVAK